MDVKEAMYEFLELQQQRDSSALESDDSCEDDGYVDILNTSNGERHSTAWVESKEHRVLRQSVSDEIAASPGYSAQDGSNDDTVDWHGSEQDDESGDPFSEDASSEAAVDDEGQDAEQATGAVEFHLNVRLHTK